MKRLAFLLLLAWPVFAQTSSTGNITAGGSTCAITNACIVLNLPNDYGGATITVSGTFSGTLQFEGSGDSIHYASLSATPLAGGSAVTSATAAGTWQVSSVGLQVVRVRCSTYTSGTVIVTIQASKANSGGIGGGAGGGAIQVATVTLTAAQLLALNATPVQVIAAPGAGKAIALLGCFARYIFGTTPFTVANGSGVNGLTLVYQPDGAPTGDTSFAYVEDTGFIDQSSSQVSFGLNSQGTSPLANAENQAIMAATVDTYTLGDGSVKLTIFYFAVTL